MCGSNKEKSELPKVVVILGPTGCGKTVWSLKLAKEFEGEIISADSRQVYKKMNIGTAKATGEWRWNGLRRTYFFEGVAHHLVDFLDPGSFFTVAEFRDKSIKYIKMINNNGHLPVVAGGTGLYIQSLVDNLRIPRIKANKKLRESLEEKSCDELTVLLNSCDPKSIESIDCSNKRRMIRALEVCILSGQPFSAQREKGEQLFNFLQIGIDTPREVLYQRINDRVDEMINVGLLSEVEKLIKQNYNWELPSMSGIGYREFKDYFEHKITLPQAIEQLKKDSRNYAKRQLTWFKRDKSIVWCKNYEEVQLLVRDFLV